SQVHGQPRSHLPVVLDVRSVAFVLKVPQKISGRKLSAIHISIEKARQIRESDRAFRVCSDVVGALINQNLATELDGMFAVENRYRVRKLINTIGPDGFRPTQTHLEIEAALE